MTFFYRTIYRKTFEGVACRPSNDLGFWNGREVSVGKGEAPLHFDRSNTHTLNMTQNAQDPCLRKSTYWLQLPTCISCHCIAAEQCRRGRGTPLTLTPTLPSALSLWALILRAQCKILSLVCHLVSQITKFQFSSIVQQSVTALAPLILITERASHPLNQVSRLDALADFQRLCIFENQTPTCLQCILIF